MKWAISTKYLCEKVWITAHKKTAVAYRLKGAIFTLSQSVAQSDADSG